MISLLVKKFIPDYSNISDNSVREKYGVLGGMLGIICNTLLFIIKLIIGAAAGSIAIISDSFNNLSDCGSSVVALLGAKLSNRRPDSEHPFGHGRSEYIASLIVSFITMLLGFELLRSSFDKIIHPAATEFSTVMFIILGLSVLIKVWMYSYNTYLGKKINSSVLIATAKDSISDVIATSAIIAASVLGHLLHLPVLDGIIGIAVSLLVIKTGLGVATDTVGLLLGKPPARETVEKITHFVSDCEGVVGVHDLIVHDYGPGRAMASIHAEVPDNSDIVKIHEAIDDCERRFFDETGIHLVIHMDPVAIDCERTNQIRQLVLDVLHRYDERLNIHDFRMTDGENRINLIFDLETPQDLVNSGKPIKRELAELLNKEDPRFNTVINIDTSFN